MRDEANRRRHRRHPFHGRLTLTPLREVGSPGPPPDSLRGRLCDIARGGIGVVAEGDVSGANLFRCVLELPDLPAPLPMLLYLRWVDDGRSGARMGLAYL